jgi:hypothetical protein
MPRAVHVAKTCWKILKSQFIATNTAQCVSALAFEDFYLALYSHGTEEVITDARLLDLLCECVCVCVCM